LDGGYYLVGMKKLHSALFAGIQWSTDSVLSQTLSIASQIGLRTALTREWYDVDTPQDLWRLMAELHTLPGTRLTHCRRLLSSWDLDLLEIW
ncbi:MAG: TIGR04282 family arsenosugar biosynthesis glycosyltransferase, partial [Anaerolineales bacterium]